MTADPVADQILAFVDKTRREGLPAEVRDTAKIFLADTLGVAVGGSVASWRNELLDMARQSGGNAEASSSARRAARSVSARARRGRG
jgi:2-methylcitrate dehydratase PrpD